MAEVLGDQGEVAYEEGLSLSTEPRADRQFSQNFFGRVSGTRPRLSRKLSDDGNRIFSKQVTLW